MSPMNDEALLRYSRQIMLDAIDIEGQERLLAGHALVVGAGGLGSPVALYLAAAGMGRLTLADDDEVELSNLQRQIAHGMADIGRPKAESARDAGLALNPDCEIRALTSRLDGEALRAAVAQADVVLDCTDRFSSRYAVNEACRHAGVPLVSGAAIRFSGQLAVFDPRDSQSPCYACLYPPGEGATRNSVVPRTAWWPPWSVSSAAFRHWRRSSWSVALAACIGGFPPSMV
ncbi:sulfur carrier protein ThiS adenylyltransferase [Halomonas elongata]|uniref:Sulfur carrier protein ThiS adenylyltransferase n=1 Tax=Halomonas elongata TaxID=2746 RepID=A0A1B8P526_HALEL|nr:sulfur carrier protein ThiS adenylyltransferase [Halomonas elongata]